MIEYIAQGGPIIYILLGLNVLGLSLIMTKFFVLWVFRFNLNFHRDQIQKEMTAMIIGKAPLELLKDEVRRKIFSLEKGISFIKMIAAIAPLLGLLGTVWGIFSTFQVMATQGLDNPELFAGGISTALITTVAGLVVAIPHVIAFHLLVGQLDYLEQKLEKKVISQAFRD